MAGRDDPTQGRDPQTDPPTLHVQGEELRALLSASERLGVPFVDLTTLRFALADLDLLPLEVARRHKVLPLLAKADQLFVAMANPGDPKAREEIEFVCGRKLVPFVADPERLARLVDAAYDARARGEEHLFGDHVQSRVPPPPPMPTLPTPPLAVPNLAMPSRSRTILSSNSGPPQRSPSSGRLPKNQSSGRHAKAPSGQSFAAVRPSPITRPPAPPPLPSSPPLAPAPTAPPALSLGTRAVWVVSGDPAVRASLAHTFSNVGHATRGFEAVADFQTAAEDVLPDVVFLDPVSARDEGYEALKTLRAQARTQKLPVVLLVTGAGSWRRDRDLRAAFGLVGLVATTASEPELIARFEAALDPAADEPATRPLVPASEAALKASTEAYLKGDLDSAIKHLQHGIELSPRSYRLHYQVALLHGRQGAVHAAIASLERSVALFDGFFPALKNLAVLYERVGFAWSGADAWERALSVAPDEATRNQIKDHLGLVAPTRRT